MEEVKKPVYNAISLVSGMTLSEGEVTLQLRLSILAQSPIMKFTDASLCALALTSGVWAQLQYTSTGTAAVAKAAATALTLSPTSKVAGKTFDRFVQIWLENTDYKLAIGDGEYWPGCRQNLMLTLKSEPQVPGVARNPPYELLRHHSSLSGTLQIQSIILSMGPLSNSDLQPNYVAVAGGSTNGISSNDFKRLPTTTKSVIDLLEAKSISWGVYQEDMPYSGFQGNYVNQKTGANAYVRKHKYVTPMITLTRQKKAGH